MNEMKRRLHGLKTRTNAELFYFKVRIHPFVRVVRVPFYSKSIP